ncbi:hypothetical protein [Leptospira ilyithenensis]|uniref:Uncharacterized protein n=1 Tax=Leptospira ilyithenensis TaxID=2484901 RepID=A0A4R9LPQ7_9LEPT|nr:hypothetical protein [Leptospira ilyithenensis]TGN09653.1 hypothetical protein EHS11_11200 [Leptospira ilyithenensis]
MDDLTYQQYLESFDKFPKITLSAFDVSILDISKSEYLNLINREEDGPELQIDSKGISIKLKSPAYIANINIIIPESEKSKELNILFRPSFGYAGLIEGKFKFEERPDLITFSIDTLVSEIVIKHKKWFFLAGDKQPVRKIILKGILTKDIIELIENFKQTISFQENYIKEITKDKLELDTKKTELVKQETQLKEKATKQETELIQKQSEAQTKSNETDILFKSKQAELKIKETELNSISSQLETLKEEINKYNKQIETSKIQLKDVKDKENSALENAKSKNLETLELDKQINIGKAELIRLSQDKSLFTEDIKGHFQEGFKQIRLYSIIVSLPIIVAISMGIGIYLNSDKVTTLLIEHPEIGIISLLSSRIPYTTISLALIAFFSTISTIFIKRMISIHKSRLRFSEIGILTKDASDSFLSGQSLSENQRQEFRLGMRMKLLREYISGKFDFDTKDDDLLNFISIKKITKKNANETSE